MSFRAGRPAPDLVAAHDAAVVAGVSAMSSGEYETALDRFTAALAHAEALGDRRKVHAARINVSGCHLGLGHHAAARAGLPAIILESSDPAHVAAAAGQLAEAFMKEGRLERASQYLRTCLEHAQACGDRRREASARSLCGQLAVMEGRPEDAVTEYAVAAEVHEDLVRLAGPAPGPLVDCRGALAVVLDNLGYAQLLAGRHAAGLATLRRSVRAARTATNARVEAEARKDAAFGFLLAGRPRSAERHALAALAIARREGLPGVTRNSCYVLMEAALRTGRKDDFDAWFERLQEQMPDLRISRDFFRMFDISDVINLKEF